MKKISILTPCYNEEGNVGELYKRVKSQFERLNFFSAVQLIFVGVLGEYIGAIYTQVRNRPLVIERERINFE